mmetsp:Transcript_7954/g.33468  ORF Transcript_7954/g.33468 Transcript_7954/m.33468 type:complete len:322 (+) Transcript_7954:1205-2170(+)
MRQGPHASAAAAAREVFQQALLLPQRQLVRPRRHWEGALLLRLHGHLQRGHQRASSARAASHCRQQVGVDYGGGQYVRVRGGGRGPGVLGAGAGRRPRGADARVPHWPAREGGLAGAGLAHAGHCDALCALRWSGRHEQGAAHEHCIQAQGRAAQDAQDRQPQHPEGHAARHRTRERIHVQRRQRGSLRRAGGEEQRTHPGDHCSHAEARCQQRPRRGPPRHGAAPSARRRSPPRRHEAVDGDVRQEGGAGPERDALRDPLELPEGSTKRARRFPGGAEGPLRGRVHAGGPLQVRVLAAAHAPHPPHHGRGVPYPPTARHR